ncbi:uncharacterized protein LOC105185812 isoform X2 [Harpegnathos saltator]|uniref:uncharacterized protein LOC105185812 isoform X2 n=1 Tax=Harpegnathos saltator TaxID=610380 RepID=UPI000DBEE187|nr:uncharacterized protein LOC105185812 isoform X2 [Harpegnathos saltator]
MQGLLLDNMNEDSLTEECRITQSLPMFICNYVRRVHFVRWQNVELYVIIVVLKEFLICLIMILLQVFDERHISSSYPEVWFEEHRELITGTRIISHRYKYFCQPITKSEHNFANGTCNKYKKMIFSHQEYYGLTRLHLREVMFSIFVTTMYRHMKIHTLFEKQLFNISSAIMYGWACTTTNAIALEDVPLLSR